MRIFQDTVFWKKLVLIGLIPLLIISVLIGTLSYRKAQEAAVSSGKISLADAVNRADISLNVRVRQLNSAVQTMGGSMLLQLAAQDPAVAGQELSVMALCQEIVAPFQEVRSVSLLAGPELVGCSLDLGEPDRELVESLYLQARQYPGKVVWSDLTHSLFPAQQDQGDRYLLVCRGIRDEQGQTIGLLVLELDADTTGSALLSKQKTFQAQVSFLVDGQGRVLYNYNTLTEEMTREILDQYHSGRRTFTFDLAGQTYTCCAQYNGMLGWVNFSVVAQKSMFPGSRELRAYLVLLVLLCLGAAFVLLMVLSRMVTQPLAKLQSGMKQVRERNFEIHLYNDRKDEIGELTEGFNDMVDEINDLINRVYREQLAQKNAELEALQAQINPHFLYNTLDSINWMLIDREAMDISAIVVALGKLMQYSMDTRTALVELSEEYHNAHDYLVIQKNRLEDQLEYQLELEPGLENFRVPKLILQPLIENAIQHGVLPTGECCRVTVQAVRRGARIRITVQDDGAGMALEELEHCRQLLSGEAEGARNIGVRNVARRLQLYFSDQCSFEVDSAPGWGTTMTLMLPIVQEERHEDRNY